MTKRGPQPTSDELRFWAKVRREPVGCWQWTASLQRNGYGIAQRGSGRGHTKRMLAHRLAYSFTHGSIPKGLCVCHTCDNPGCVRPSHLWVGTNRENTQDMLAKGRCKPPRGEKCGRAKLRAQDILQIRARIEIGELRSSVAASFGVHRETVRKIIAGERWTSI